MRTPTRPVTCRCCAPSATLWRSTPTPSWSGRPGTRTGRSSSSASAPRPSCTAPPRRSAPWPSPWEVSPPACAGRAGERPDWVVMDDAAETDAALAVRLAVEAGQLLVNVRDTLGAEGAYPWQIMDTGDMTSHRFLMQELHRARPDDIVLSEEGVEDVRRFHADRVWIVDPLDGTNEFGEHGRHDWAVHVALWERGVLTAAAVSLPVLEAVFATDPAPVLRPIDRERPRLVTSRSRNPYSAVIVANALGADAVRLGSAGAKAMAVVLGEA